MEWVSVKEALPEENRPILITVRYKDWGKPADETGEVLWAICVFSKKEGWRILEEPEIVRGENGDVQTIEHYSEIWIKYIITHWMYWPDPAPLDDGLRMFHTELLKEGETIK